MGNRCPGCWGSDSSVMSTPLMPQYSVEFAACSKCAHLFASLALRTHADCMCKLFPEHMHCPCTSPTPMAPSPLLLQSPYSPPAVTHVWGVLAGRRSWPPRLRGGGMPAQTRMSQKRKLQRKMQGPVQERRTPSFSTMTTPLTTPSSGYAVMPDVAMCTKLAPKFGRGLLPKGLQHGRGGVFCLVKGSFDSDPV